MAWHHSHKKQKGNLETQSFLLIFWLELKYLEWLYREYIKTAKNGSFCEELLREITSLLPACWRYKPGFCFFPDINKNE